MSPAILMCVFALNGGKTVVREYYGAELTRAEREAVVEPGRSLGNAEIVCENLVLDDGEIEEGSGLQRAYYTHVLPPRKLKLGRRGSRETAGKVGAQ